MHRTHFPLTRDLLELDWAGLQPQADALIRQPINPATFSRWLSDWSDLSRLVSEIQQRLYVAVTTDTGNLHAKQRYHRFLDEMYPASQIAFQHLKTRLLESGLESTGMAIFQRNSRAEAALFRQANLPLLSEELKLWSDYDEIIGAQTVPWDCKEVTLVQLAPVSLEEDRTRRECAWRLASARRLADREIMNELWMRLLALRRRMAANAGLPNYRLYSWQKLLRFSYTPQDCAHFHRAIEDVVVPAAQHIYEKRRQRLGLKSLRPWDLNVDPAGRPPLRPFRSVRELEEKTAAIFYRLDPALGSYFEVMRRERLLDLENRKGKAPGGYCTSFDLERKPFIFMNAVGIHDDVQTLLHEGGHAFHVFETAHLPYHGQLQIGMEFIEVASMSMEHLAAPFLTDHDSGFYTCQEAARARIEHLTNDLSFWPYMAVVDAFQHWAYTHPDRANDPARCDAEWLALWERFMKGIDVSGLEVEIASGWKFKPHIMQSPFYYIEYGLASLGAHQVWHNALRDQAQAVRSYRRALSLGGTATIPELYAAAGARFTLGARTLRRVVERILKSIKDLERV